MSASRRRILWILAAVVVLVASVAVPAMRVVRWFGDSALDVPVYEVRRADFVHRVHAEGNLQAAEATVLGPPARSRRPLRIAWLETDGARVREGDVVIRFDPTDIEKELAEGTSDRAKAESRITKQSVREGGEIRNLERNSELAEMELDHAREFQSKDSDVFSRVEIIESDIDGTLAAERKEHADDVRKIRGDLAEVQLDLLGIEKRKADLKVQQAEEGLQELEVRAPHDGIFVLKAMWGRVPQVGQMAWGGNPIAEIPQLDVMDAEVFVLEADAGGLEVGLSAIVTLDAHPGNEYKATVKKVDALANRRSRQAPVQYFAVSLELEQTDPVLMKPGQRVRSTLYLGEREAALAVPRQAIFEHDGESVVYVDRGGQFEPQPVEVGPAALGRVVVESGIEEGDRIALSDPTQGPLDGGDGDAASDGPVAGAAL